MAWKLSECYHMRAMGTVHVEIQYKPLLIVSSKSSNHMVDTPAISTCRYLVSLKHVSIMLEPYMSRLDSFVKVERSQITESRML